MSDQELHLRKLIDQLERENAALKQRCETCETGAVLDGYVREYDALRTAAVEVCAIARVWATVWHDKLSLESIRRFTELEQQVLKRGAAANDAAREGKQ